MLYVLALILNATFLATGPTSRPVPAIGLGPSPGLAIKRDVHVESDAERARIAEIRIKLRMAHRELREMSSIMPESAWYSSHVHASRRGEERPDPERVEREIASLLHEM